MILQPAGSKSSMADQIVLFFTWTDFESVIFYYVNFSFPLFIRLIFHTPPPHPPPPPSNTHFLSHPSPSYISDEHTRISNVPNHFNHCFLTTWTINSTKHSVNSVSVSKLAPKNNPI